MYVSSAITSSVKWDCSDGDNQDITSALAVRSPQRCRDGGWCIDILQVWDLYCSAARAQVKPTGITNSGKSTVWAPLPRGETDGAGSRSANSIRSHRRDWRDWRDAGPKRDWAWW